MTDTSKPIRNAITKNAARILCTDLKAFCQYVVATTNADGVEIVGYYNSLVLFENVPEVTKKWVNVYDPKKQSPTPTIWDAEAQADYYREANCIGCLEFVYEGDKLIHTLFHKKVK